LIDDAHLGASEKIRPKQMTDIRFYIQKCGWFPCVMSPGLHAILLYRFGRRLYLSKYRRTNPVWYAYLFFLHFFRLFHKIELPETARIGKHLFLPHPYGLVMGANTVVGDDCTIGPWVVLGHNGTPGGDPVIGDRVIIAPHACVLGKIQIGPGSLIGAGVIVTRDVGAGERLSSPRPFIIDTKVHQE
jgi:serine acetyltransferase